MFGAGGVAKETARVLARNDVGVIGIINRTYSKAVAIADELNKKHKQIAYGAPENLIRGVILNSEKKPDAIINTTDKGSDGPLVEYSAFSHVSKDGPGTSETIARNNLRILKQINPDVIINDIALTKKGETVTVRLAKSESREYN